jgi:hypothetical protein
MIQVVNMIVKKNKVIMNQVDQNKVKTNKHIITQIV